MSSLNHHLRAPNLEQQKKVKQGKFWQVSAPKPKKRQDRKGKAEKAEITSPHKALLEKKPLKRARKCQNPV